MKEFDVQQIPRRRRILFLSVPYLFVALLIVGIEVATRLFLPRIPPLDVLVDSPSLQQDLGEARTRRFSFPILCFFGESVRT